MSSYVIANQPVVIDNGSGVIKAGFAGEQNPKCRFPNFVGRPKHVRVMAGALEGDIFVGGSLRAGGYGQQSHCGYVIQGRRLRSIAGSSHSSTLWSTGL